MSRPAVQSDVPCNRILRNQALLEIVNQWPKNNYELSRVDDIKRAIIRNDGAQILSFLKNAQKSAEENPPEPILRPLPYFWNKPLKKLKAIVRECAADLDVAPEIMLRKKELDALIRSGLDDKNYQMPEQRVSPWRRRRSG